MSCSTPTKSVSYRTLSYLSASHLSYLDNYVITSYTYVTKDALEVLASNVYLENIYLPAPKTEADKEIYAEILTLKEKYEASFIPYEENELIDISEFVIFPAYYDNEGKFAATLLYKNEFYTYLSADMLETSTKNTALKLMLGANTVIVGSTGYLYDGYSFTYKIPDETKLIYNKKSGLTDEILDYYGDRITVDPSGSIDLYVE